MNSPLRTEDIEASPSPYILCEDSLECHPLSVSLSHTLSLLSSRDNSGRISVALIIRLTVHSARSNNLDLLAIRWRVIPV
jgi:hypothetical protein